MKECKCVKISLWQFSCVQFSLSLLLSSSVSIFLFGLSEHYTMALYSQCTQSMAALKLGLTEREIEYREQWFRSDEGLSSVSSGIFVS